MQPEAKVGYLTKRPVRGRHPLAQPRLRYFVMRERYLDWFANKNLALRDESLWHETSTDAKGRMYLEGARVSRESDTIVLTAANQDRLVLTGEDLDGWVVALEARCESLVARPPANASPEPSAAAAALSHLPQEMRALTSLDDRLLVAFEHQDIRLLRSKWLLQQPPSFRLPRRQDLEAREQEDESPLLSGEEAVKLIRKCKRNMGSLTHGWLTPGARSLACWTLRARLRPICPGCLGFSLPACACASGDPDPEGERVKVVCRALKEHPHIEGVFWDVRRALGSNLPPRKHDKSNRCPIHHRVRFVLAVCIVVPAHF